MASIVVWLSFNESLTEAYAGIRPSRSPDVI